MSFKRRMDKQILIQPHNGIRFTNEKGQTLITACMNLTDLKSIKRSQTQENTSYLYEVQKQKSVVVKIRVAVASWSRSQNWLERGLRKTFWSNGICLDWGESLCNCQNCTVKVCAYHCLRIIPQFFKSPEIFGDNLFARV